MSHHTFTYRHSDLPELRPEITAEIIALGLHADDLILKSCGNYRELKELAETLNNSLNTCELNLNSIRIIPDDNPQPAPLTITDLPADEQRLIFETATFGAVGLKMITMLNPLANPELIMNQLSQAVQIALEDMSETQITERLKEYLEMHKNNLCKEVFRSNLQHNN